VGKPEFFDFFKKKINFAVKDFLIRISRNSNTKQRTFQFVDDDLYSTFDFKGSAGDPMGGLPTNTSTTTIRRARISLGKRWLANQGLPTMAAR